MTALQSLRLVCLSVILVMTAGVATAHRIDESYVYFQVTEDALTGRIEVTSKDLAQAFTFDGDSRLPTNDQIEARADEIFDHFADRLLILAEGQRYPVTFTGLDFLDTDIAAFALFSFDIPGLAPVPDAIEMSYEFLFNDVDPGHLGFALIESNTRTGVRKNESHISLTFGPGGGVQTLGLTADPPGKVFVDFVVHGIWHIWHGIDHLMFLAALLLAATMTRRDGHWAPTENLGRSMGVMVGLVTAFTLGHALAISLSAFGVIRFPSTWVEGAIALSIILVALANLMPGLQTRSGLALFAFGLFHGFGFVSVLPLLGADPMLKTVGLIGFTIGIELAQLAIVLVAFPVLYLVCNWRIYPMLALRLGSVGVIAIAAVWFAERSYNFLGPVRQTLAGLAG
ncbi:MAG: HupE/UreJ family protein [Pseudomonadota bacterium]